jgi:prepilin-type N-terminal cleavage/methylation domain-containing protein
MRARAGFTVIELLIAIGVGAVVARSALPELTGLARTLRLATSARTLAQRLRETRARAIAEGSPIDARFDATAGTWAIVGSDGTIRETHALAPAVSFGGLPGSGRIRFGTTGVAENGTIVLATGAADRRIVVNQRGRVRLL